MILVQLLYRNLRGQQMARMLMASLLLKGLLGS